MGAAVLAAGWALWTGRRWGRGIAVFAQLLLLPWPGTWRSGRTVGRYGIPVALVVVVALALLFSPSALQWLGLRTRRPARPGQFRQRPNPTRR